MTRMIPPTIHSSVKSHAERRMYEVIRNAPNTEHWVCLEGYARGLDLALRQPPQHQTGTKGNVTWFKPLK
jgi:hypothetical protein